MLLDIAGQATGYQIQGFLPGDPHKFLAYSFQGILEPLLMIQDLQDGIALGAEGALTGGVVGHILNAGSNALLYSKVHTATYCTIGAKRRH